MNNRTTSRFLLRISCAALLAIGLAPALGHAQSAPPKSDKAPAKPSQEKSEDGAKPEKKSENKPEKKEAEKKEAEKKEAEKKGSGKKDANKKDQSTEKKPADKKDSKEGAKELREKAARKAEEKEAAIRKVLNKKYPTSISDLKVIQDRVLQTVKKVMPATVGVRVGGSSGSGVIISEDGYVLTAGHVTAKPGRNVVLIFPDGRQVRGKSLGLNRDIDSGMIKITEKGKWPHVKMASPESIKAGQWCVATGHPGGYLPGRTPPIRLGRVLFRNDKVLCTDCTLVGGDSGGPLFNLDGEVIGINSRIGQRTTTNLHVPIKTYHETWDRLVAGKMWGGPRNSSAASHIAPVLGVAGPRIAKSCRITQVFPNSPAKLAGLKVGDVIREFDGVEIAGFGQLATLLNKKRPGQSVKIQLARADETIDVEVRLGARTRAMPGGAKPTPVPEDKLKKAEKKKEAEKKAQEEKAKARKAKEKKEKERKAQEKKERELKKPEEKPEEKTEEKQNESKKDSEEQLKKETPERRPYLGVANVVDAVEGECRIGRVLPGNPAERAGIRAGDVILTFNGEKVSSFQDLTNKVKASAPGEKVTLEIRRGEESLTIEASLGAKNPSS